MPYIPIGQPKSDPTDDTDPAATEEWSTRYFLLYNYIGGDQVNMPPHFDLWFKKARDAIRQANEHDARESQAKARPVVSIQMARQIAQLTDDLTRSMQAYSTAISVAAHASDIPAKISTILAGIDATETDELFDEKGDYIGWWETSTGAMFGKGKLQDILSLFNPAASSDNEGNRNG